MDLAWALDYSWIIVVAPLVSFLICFLVGHRLWEGGAPVAIGAMGVSLVMSTLVFIHALSNGAIGGTYVPEERVWLTWLGVEGESRLVEIGILFDNLSVFMLLLVSLLCLLIVIYSVGYMHGEPFGKGRYYGEISLFVAGMLGTVSASNYLQLMIFWEIMGLCSYLLIGFWYYKPEAASAAKKAFMVTRVGDVMFLAAILAVFIIFNTFNFREIEEAMINEGRGSFPGFLAFHQLAPELALIVPLLIFGGAIGKSAQFPLHGWLPDAMEGPTTVSALIHAATMVKAGVYLTARSIPLIMGNLDASLFVAVIGGFTALFAATQALAQYDIKRVLAYSTISQLGYMFLALGSAAYALALLGPGGDHEATVHAQEGYTAGVFHLMNHAFFKALLFLGAGSVIHAVHSNDMRAMGGLRRVMPITALTMLVGTLAISGVPPLSGFWSKDAILEVTFKVGEQQPIFLLLWVLGIVTAFLTAFYMFRLWFMTFRGESRWGHTTAVAHNDPATRQEAPEARTTDVKAPEAEAVEAAHEPSPIVPREEHGEPHESPLVMTGVLMVLAVFAFISGLFIFFMGGFGNFIFLAEFHETTPPVDILLRVFLSPESLLTYASLLVSLGGIGLAYMVYGVGRISPTTFTATPLRAGLHQLLERRYYVDTVYNAVAVGGVWAFARLADLFDRRVVDGFVNAVGYGTLKLARAADWVDRRGIDGAVSAVSLGATRTGWRLRNRQTGFVQEYVAVIVLGMAIVLLLMLFILPRLGVR